MRFDLLFGVGVGVAFFRRGEAVGDGVGVGFFVECFRCLRDGVGLGFGSRTFLILVPNDSSAARVVVPPDKRARSNRQRIIVLMSIDVVGRFCETPVSGG